MRRTLLVVAVCGLVWAGQVVASEVPEDDELIIDQSIIGAVLVPSPVPKTGQTLYVEFGGDGYYQAGMSVDRRFTDNGNGTVKDGLTHLIWLQDADCFGRRDWFQAISDANTLADGACGLTDGSVVGDWRLPNVRELQSLIDFGAWGGIPAVPPGHPFSGVQRSGYWSSTTYAWGFPLYAWRVSFADGGTGVMRKTGYPHAYVWPVRGGQ